MPQPVFDLDAACGGLDQRVLHGDVAGVRADIERLLADPAPDDDRRTTGLLLRRACCDLALGRVAQAYQTAMQVAEAGGDQDHAPREIEALALAALAATRLGLHDDALVHAARARQFADTASPDAQPAIWRAQAAFALAFVLGWAGDGAGAEPLFDEAGQPALLRRQVALHRAWVRLLHGPGLPDDAAAAPVPLAALTDDGAPGHALPPVVLAAHQDVDGSGRLLQALLREPPADQDLDAVAASLDALAVGPRWLQAAASWGASAVAQRRGDADGAARHACRMVERAGQVDHLPLRRLAYRLASARLAAQGRHEPALAQLSAMLAMDAPLAAAQRRTRQAEARDAIARRDAHQRLAAERDTFRRWAHEDALTGLGNHRAFQHRLDAWERDPHARGRPMCVATIDVDRFKQINDTFSHAVGDAVLTRIAGILRSEIRAGDLALRWGGDEFALLFEEADLDTAQQVADRVERAVREHDWRAIAPTLSASVSVGVAEALPGDTKDSLTRRSDTAMFDRKRARDRNALLEVASPALLRRVDGWLRDAQRVTFLVGLADPPEAGLPESPGELLESLVALSRRVKQPLFVTERSDGLLQRAGATDVIELFGNVHRMRCTVCHAVRPFVHRGQCLDCGAEGSSIEPDVTALGAPLDAQVLNRAKMAMKLSELVVVAGGPLGRRDAVSLLQRAGWRDVNILVLGDGGFAPEQVCHLRLRADPRLALRVLLADLAEAQRPWPEAAELSAAGTDIALFLAGQGSDERGRRLPELLGHRPEPDSPPPFAALPWMFPLTTRSQLNPAAPVPTPADFARLAGDRAAVAGLRQALDWVLVRYGLSMGPDGLVVRRAGASPWSLRWIAHPGPDDLILSRILGALTLFGLRSEALGLLQALEQEVVRARGVEAQRPLGFWRLACGRATEAPTPA